MAQIINLVLPGLGLVLLRKEWLGAAVAMLFAICVNITIAGFVIAPDAIPVWLSGVAGGLGCVVWAFSQAACRKQLRCLREQRVRIETLLADAAAARQHGDSEAARTAMEAARAIAAEISAELPKN
ncbi:MAG: hypothetical protein KF841_04245 [Phycisphaerae bacterium]|nr:hypothetical protein [Phycisphaerae bacterium]